MIGLEPTLPRGNRNPKATTKGIKGSMSAPFPLLATVPLDKNGRDLTWGGDRNSDNAATSQAME
jgi:hypothetical protein